LQELRGTYGIKAPAPICLDPEVDAGPGQGAQVVIAGGDDDATCQTVQAPAGSGSRLVPDLIDARRRGAGDEAEIRLTYRELSALIEDAIRNLR
jgi:hypothetical protein